VTRIVLIRHGQTEWNREFRFRGRKDVDLDETGRVQALACARRVASRWKPVAVYSSPLSRAVHTAEPIAAQLELRVVVRPHLIDMSFGDWEGLSMAEARAKWPDVLAGWLQDPASVRPPRGEPLETLRERTVTELRALAHLHDDATIAVVSHDAVNRVLILAALEGSLGAFFRVGQDTAAINVIEIGEAEMRVQLANDTCHLA
jgi:broad specificity phosphatase PhoE